MVKSRIIADGGNMDKPYINKANLTRLYGHLQIPYECEFKNRTPDPQRCIVLSIDFENRTLDVSNGCVRLSPSFDDVNVFIVMNIVDETKFSKCISF
jgi:hypothetical protein